MKRLLLAAAVVGLATTGCAQNRILSGRGLFTEAGHVTRSQLAPRPEIVRTAFHQGDGLLRGNLRDRGRRHCKSHNCGDSCCSSASDRLGPCNSCGGVGCGLCRRIVGSIASGLCPHSGGYPESYNYTPSPPMGQVAYPYYTVRGPRDFLQCNPPSIGPY